MKAYWGSGCIDPHFLDLGTSWNICVQTKSKYTIPVHYLRNVPRILDTGHTYGAMDDTMDVVRIGKKDNI
jgi:hypothetical protein